MNFASESTIQPRSKTTIRDVVILQIEFRKKIFRKTKMENSSAHTPEYAVLQLPNPLYSSGISVCIQEKNLSAVNFVTDVSPCLTTVININLRIKNPTVFIVIRVPGTLNQLRLKTTFKDVAKEKLLRNASDPKLKKNQEPTLNLYRSLYKINISKFSILC